MSTLAISQCPRCSIMVATVELPNHLNNTCPKRLATIHEESSWLVLVCGRECGDLCCNPIRLDLDGLFFVGFEYCTYSTLVIWRQFIWRQCGFLFLWLFFDDVHDECLWRWKSLKTGLWSRKSLKTRFHILDIGLVVTISYWPSLVSNTQISWMTRGIFRNNKYNLWKNTTVYTIF